MTRNDAFQRLLSEAKQLRLTDHEKEEGRSALLARIALNDAATIALSAEEKAMGRGSLIASMRLQADREPTSAWWTVISVPLLRMPALALSALIIVLGSGALAYASESAIPGDPLYALKVDVLEPFREKMIRTPQKQAVWQIRKVERRLREAQQLAGRGKLTTQNRAELERRISLQVVTLQDTLLPPPSVETHVAVQEVLATTFEKYEESFPPAVAPAAFGGPEDRAKKSEEDHLRQFVRERGNAARSEANFILKRAASDSSTKNADVQGEIRIGIKVSGSAKARSRSTPVQSQDVSEEASDEDRDGRSAAQEKKSRSSRADMSSSTDSSAEASTQSNASTESAAAAEASSVAEGSTSSEQEKNLREKVEEQKEIIEHGLLP